MLEEHVDRFLVALHDIEHALGQPGLRKQTGQKQGSRWVALGRLQDEGVAAGDRERKHPHRDHHRKIERGDPRAHAQRLAQGEVVDAAPHVVAELALEQLRHAAREFHHFDAAQHFASGIAEHLAVLAGDDAGELVVVRFQQLLELEHHPGPAQRRPFTPGREGRVRRDYRRIDHMAIGEDDFGRHGAGRRIEHRRAPAAGRKAFSGDSVPNGLEAERSVGHGGLLIPMRMTHRSSYQPEERGRTHTDGAHSHHRAVAEW